MPKIVITIQYLSLALTLAGATTCNAAVFIRRLPKLATTAVAASYVERRFFTMSPKAAEDTSKKFTSPSLRALDKSFAKLDTEIAEMDAKAAERAARPSIKNADHFLVQIKWPFAWTNVHEQVEWISCLINLKNVTNPAYYNQYDDQRSARLNHILRLLDPQYILTLKPNRVTQALFLFAQTCQNLTNADNPSPDHRPELLIKHAHQLATDVLKQIES